MHLLNERLLFDNSQLEILIINRAFYIAWKHVHKLLFECSAVTKGNDNSVISSYDVFELYLG